MNVPDYSVKVIIATFQICKYKERYIQKYQMVTPLRVAEKKIIGPSHFCMGHTKCSGI